MVVVPALDWCGRKWWCEEMGMERYDFHLWREWLTGAHVEADAHHIEAEGARSLEEAERHGGVRAELGSETAFIGEKRGVVSQGTPGVMGTGTFRARK